MTGFVTLTVTTNGFDGVNLRRDEPGLFDPAAGPAVAPLFHIRRAVSPVADPVYARRIAGGTLALQPSTDGTDVFVGKATDENGGRGLEPFVRYVYWAEVRLPPERRLPVGVAPTDAAVTTPYPQNAADHPRPISLPSAPRTLLRAPSNAPSALDPADIQVTRALNATGGATLTITLTNPPVAHPSAIVPFRLAAWGRWPTADFQHTRAPDGTPFGPDWPALGDDVVSAPTPQPPAIPTDPLTVLVAIVDPLGRVGATISVTVP